MNGYSDQILKKSQGVIDTEPSQKKPSKKVLFEDAAIAPVYQASRAQLISPKVEGVFVNPFGATYEYKWADVGE